MKTCFGLAWINSFGLETNFRIIRKNWIGLVNLKLKRERSYIVGQRLYGKSLSSEVKGQNNKGHELEFKHERSNAYGQNLEVEHKRS